MLKLSYKNNDFKRLAQLARPYYLEDGPNAWTHIQEVRRRAQKMMRALEGRSLTPEEYAAVLMHDSTKLDMGGKDHGRLGAQRAAKVLAAALPKEQLAKATEAIAVHDDNLKKFPSHTAELLASADANPPDLDWLLNKSYNWAIRHGIKGDARYEHPLEQIPGKYGTNGSFNYPEIYKKYYGDRVDKYLADIDALDVPTIKKRIDVYRQKWNIGPDETKVIHNV